MVSTPNIPNIASQIPIPLLSTFHNHYANPENRIAESSGTLNHSVTAPINVVVNNIVADNSYLNHSFKAPQHQINHSQIIQPSPPNLLPVASDQLTQVNFRRGGCYDLSRVGRRKLVP